jgi:hypothetical protein
MADKKIGFFTPEQAREVWETIKQLRSSGLLKNKKRKPENDDPGLHQVRVYNSSGEEVPAFACMQIVDTEIIDEVTYLKIDKPDSTDGSYIFNNAATIEIDGRGIGYTWGIVRMLGSGAAVPLSGYSATVGSWEISPDDSGPFVVYGDDAAGEGIFKGRILASGKAQLLEFRFPTPYEYDEVPTECDLRNTDGEGGHNVEVIKRPCGQATAAGEVDGYVDVIDDLGLLDGRDFRDLAGRKGIATRLQETGGLCEWVIVYVDFHREIQVVTDIIFSSNGLTIERKLVKVWDDCDMPPEEIEGADCTPDVEYY